MDLSLQMLRIFCKVVEEKSFSGAARSLHITQPTVSQQIGRLENEVGSKLFERVRHAIHVTPTGVELYQTAQELLEKTNDFSERLKEQKTQPSGLVRYAMPESCQWTPHYRRIMTQIRDLPRIRFEILVLPNGMILEKLMRGEVDFGFVAGDRLNSELRFEKFSDECYLAIAANKQLFGPLKNGNFEDLRIISYPGWEDFFITWAKAYDLWKVAKKRLPASTVSVGTLAGAIHATQEGAGVAIIPSHCVSSEIESGALHVFNPGKAKDSIQPIYLARRMGEKLPRRVELVMDLLKTAKATLG
jgi:DNA-binding transcriptional LysR family regulator